MIVSEACTLVWIGRAIESKISYGLLQVSRLYRPFAETVLCAIEGYTLSLLEPSERVNCIRVSLERNEITFLKMNTPRNF